MYKQIASNPNTYLYPKTINIEIKNVSINYIVIECIKIFSLLSISKYQYFHPRNFFFTYNIKALIFMIYIEKMLSFVKF